MRWIWVAVLTLLLAPGAAWAQDADTSGAVPLPDTSVEGVRTMTPIAVPNTYNLGDADPNGLETIIADTIRNCLEISGYFEVFGPDRYFFDPDAEGMTVASIDFQNWYNVGSQALVKTAFRVAGGQINLDFRLYDVDNQVQIPLNWQGGTVTFSRVESEVYAFVNAIIEFYTGSPGIFGAPIAFVGSSAGGGKQVYTVQMDGSGLGAMTSIGSLNLLPEFGPGGELMYTSYRNGNPDLFLGTGRDAQILSARPGMNTGARLSPDGSEIAMTMTKDGNAEIYVIDAGGDIVRRCTENNAEDVSPTWSPDGSQIAFVSDRSGGPQIYVMNRDCSGQRRVTFAGSYNTEPEWSPLGDVIAFTGRDERNRFDIFTVEPGTGFISRLTQDQGDNKSPTWSPDGRYVAFSSTRGGSSGSIYVMTADGYFQHNITPNGAGFETPRWGG